MFPRNRASCLSWRLGREGGQDQLDKANVIYSRLSRNFGFIGLERGGWCNWYTTDRTNCDWIKFIKIQWGLISCSGMSPHLTFLSSVMDRKLEGISKFYGILGSIHIPPLYYPYYNKLETSSSNFKVMRSVLKVKCGCVFITWSKLPPIRTTNFSN